MKCFSVLGAVFFLLCAAPSLPAACTTRDVTVSLEFSGTEVNGCYHVTKGGNITATLCVANPTACSEAVRVALYASTTSFDSCAGTGNSKVVFTKDLTLAPGEQKCVELTVNIPATAPTITLYYQAKAQTLGKRIPNVTSCSEVECVQILDP